MTTPLKNSELSKRTNDELYELISKKLPTATGMVDGVEDIRDEHIEFARYAIEEACDILKERDVAIPASLKAQLTFIDWSTPEEKRAVFLERFLGQASFATLAQATRTHEVFTANNRAETMAWLAQHRKVMYYQVLGCLYDVAVYPVDGTGVTVGAPPSELGMFFSSTLAEDFPDAPEIPLQTSMEASYQVTCEVLGLAQLFAEENEAGESLGRYCRGPVKLPVVVDPRQEIPF